MILDEFGCIEDNNEIKLIDCVGYISINFLTNSVDYRDWTTRLSFIIFLMFLLVSLIDKNSVQLAKHGLIQKKKTQIRMMTFRDQKDKKTH